MDHHCSDGEESGRRDTWTRSLICGLGPGRPHDRRHRPLSATCPLPNWAGLGRQPGTEGRLHLLGMPGKGQEKWSPCPSFPPPAKRGTGEGDAPLAVGSPCGGLQQLQDPPFPWPGPGGGPSPLSGPPPFQTPWGSLLAPAELAASASGPEGLPGLTSPQTAGPSRLGRVCPTALRAPAEAAPPQPEAVQAQVSCEPAQGGQCREGPFSGQRQETPQTLP